jgi:endonuclease YncB( thermonuclease family)
MKPAVWLSCLGVLVQAPLASAQTNCGQLPKTWEGQAYAASGDTLAGVGLKPQIALWGIKAPDMQGIMNSGESVRGMRARAALEDLLVTGNHKVSCRMVAWGRGCHALAQCTVVAAWPTGSAPQPHDIGHRLVEDGMAYGFELNNPPEWDKDAAEKIAHFEALARQARKGLWPDWLGEPPKP